MENVTNELSKAYLPKAALIVYSNGNNDYYLESRPIKENGQMAAAKPVSKKFMLAIVKNFKDSKETTPHGVMPPNMLYADSRIGQELYVWWTPPQERHMCFSDRAGLPDAVYQMPGCVYKTDGKRLWVYVFEGRRPNPKKKLLYGPFFNYYADGSVCLGSARVDWPKDITWEAIQEHWERLFWASENSHMIENPMKDRNNMMIALKAAIDKPFDTSLLKETNTTINKLLGK